MFELRFAIHNGNPSKTKEKKLELDKFRGTTQEGVRACVRAYTYVHFTSSLTMPSTWRAQATLPGLGMPCVKMADSSATTGPLLAKALLTSLLSSILDSRDELRSER